MVDFPTAYEGTEPYIFISYAHKNTDRVIPIISALQSRGFRVWYDAGIEVGTEWPEYIADHVAECGCFAAMITKEALESHNCRREINFAISKEIPMLTVYLEDVELSPGMEMQLGVLQALFRSRHSNFDSFMEKLCASALLQPCKATVNVGISEVFIKTPSPKELYEQGRKKYEEKNYPEAVKLFKASALQGYAAAQHDLGYCYDQGYGVEQNDGEAVKWYRLAAEQGDANAQYNLGVCYFNGEGVEQDYEEAVKWYRLAAGQGFAHAQFNLGVCCFNGEGVEQDYEEATKWYRLAAEQGYARAQYNLGVCYDFGEGVEQNYEKAVNWYRLAAKQGFSDAQRNLGLCYFDGLGVEQDHEKAVKWFRLAAQQGDADAQYGLGVCYKRGDGVAKDHEKARAWLTKAAEQGHDRAKRELLFLF